MFLSTTVAKNLLAGLLWKIHPRLFERVVHYYGGVFSIGIYEGKDLFSLKDAVDVINPVLSADDIKGVPAAFVADPFVIHKDQKHYMFFEVFNKATDKGEIGLAISQDGLKWSYECIVLRKSFHLAYPYVFKWDKNYYMIPDSYGNGVRLFKAKQFPYEWEYTSLMLDGDSFVDSSIFYFKDKWWLFTATSKKPSDPTTLYLFYADKPTGPWIEHLTSPIVELNYNISRPAGKVILINGQPIRFAQDGMPKYGSSVRAFEILELSSTTYIEREVGLKPILFGSCKSWNSEGMHHIDAHLRPDGSWIAYVDGWYVNEPVN